MGWYPRLSTGQLSFFRHIPKIELHRHLEGSLRLETLRQLAVEHDIPLPGGDFRALVQMQWSDPLNFTSFLSKFQVLRQFYRSPEIIRRITREAIADAAADGVVYMELRFTPAALARLQGYPLDAVIDWVRETAEEASRAYAIETRLIVSVNRNEPVELAESVARLAVDRLDCEHNGGIVGMDLAGNEANFPGLPFADLFREAAESGLHLTIHAGEWGPAANVRQAIQRFNAERIGHGVRIMEDPSVVELARERGTVFEVCATSNFQTGVIGTLADHPLARMIDAGLLVTINTDDPSVSGITLSDEYRLALEELRLDQRTLANCTVNAVRAAFVPERVRALLEQKL